MRIARICRDGFNPPMLLGALSDTHDHADAMAAGVAALRQRGAEYILHCGDVGPPSILDPLAGIPSAFVFGNTDDQTDALARYAKEIGVLCCDYFGDLTLGGKRVALMHGDDSRRKYEVINGQQFDYYFQGHTHLRHDSRMGRTRLINPGALFRAALKTVALLDTDTDTLTFIEVALPPTPGGG